MEWIPGRPVRGSTTGRPIMVALDLLGRRWTLRLLWELRDGPLGPRAMLGACPGLSSSVLYRRIGELVEAGLVERQPDGSYALTELGRDLGEAISPLNRWSERWAGSLEAEGLDRAQPGGPVRRVPAGEQADRQAHRERGDHRPG